MALEKKQSMSSSVLSSDAPQLIDLSVSIRPYGAEPDPPKIKYLNHKKGAWLLSLGAAVAGKKTLAAKVFSAAGFLVGFKKIRPRDFPQQMGIALEIFKSDTHSGTHLDAPWHFGPYSGSESAKTVDEVPLDWCYGDGVVLDMTYKDAGTLITIEDLQVALDKIEYSLKPLDIVLIRTDADKHYDDDDYLDAQPGMSREATLWLLDQGVKLIGIDAFCFDRSWNEMLKGYLSSKDSKELWPAHFAGREREYCHIEKMANLDKIPVPFGFKVACFPIKIEGASAGWVRPVAIVNL